MSPGVYRPPGEMCVDKEGDKKKNLWKADIKTKKTSFMEPFNLGGNHPINLNMPRGQSCYYRNHHKKDNSCWVSSVLWSKYILLNMCTLIRLSTKWFFKCHINGKFLHSTQKPNNNFKRLISMPDSWVILYYLSNIMFPAPWLFL